MSYTVPFMIRSTYHPTLMAMTATHHFQSQSQRGPLDIWFASRSFIGPDLTSSARGAKMHRR